MSHSTEETASLSVKPLEPLGPWDLPRRIQITDGTLSLVAKGFGELLDVALPPGVYRARVESVQAPYEQMIFLAPGQQLSISYPSTQNELLDSPAPVPGTDAMHETMRNALDRSLRRLPMHGSRLLVMATRSAPDQARIHFRNLRLLDAHGSSRIATGHTWENGPNNAFKLFTRDCGEGGLILEGLATSFSQQTPLRQLIWCSRGWCTLVFLAADCETGSPDLDTASVYQWRIGSSFAPEASDGPTQDTLPMVLESQRSTELALQSLASGRKLLSIDEIDRHLLVPKFENPMLGILGCHLLLEQSTTNKALIRTVIGNLARLVPRHPDVAALKVMANRAGVKGMTGPPPQVPWPPMLRKGFLALRDEDWRRPGTIAKGSLFDRVRSNALSGGVWSRWVADTQSTRHLARQHGLSYAKQIQRRGKHLLPEDFRWLGMSREQARAFARSINMKRDSQLPQSNARLDRATRRLARRAMRGRMLKEKS